MIKITGNKVESLVLLRAVAVVLVVFCHSGHPLEDKSLFGVFFELMHDYGKYGVHIFFVVSGFIIPYSLYKSHYTLNNYFKFLYKRLIRLHPPYLFALLLTLVISFFSYKLRHLIFPETLKSVFLSFFYFHAPADNPVFWTLAVEAQYYLLIGIIFVILIRYSKLMIILLTLFSVFFYYGNVLTIFSFFSYMIFFVIGIVAFFFLLGIGNIYINLLSITIIGFSILINGQIAEFVSSFFAFGIIIFYDKKISKFVNFIGEISYSIYLIHFPIGVKLINLSKRYVISDLYIALFIFSFILILLVSKIFYEKIEKPFARMSSRISYGG